MTAPGGSADIGSLLAYLKMDASQFDREIDQAGAKADALSRHSPDITIRTNAKTAIAQLAAVDAAQRKLADATGRVEVAQARLNSVNEDGNASAEKKLAAQKALERALNSRETAVTRLVRAQHDLIDGNRSVADSETGIGKKADDAQKSLHLLSTALLAVASAAIPIAGVAVGAIAGLVPVAATALLAVKGLQNAWKSGALQGTAFAKQVNVLKGDLSGLERAAAAGVLSGLTNAMKSLQPLMPTVNRDVALMSTQLGSIVQHIAPGLVALFTRLNPLFATVGDQLVRGSAAFEHWAQSSTAVSRFVAYVQTALPEVETTMGSLITTVSHVVEGLAPFGSTALTGIRLFSTAINLVPIGVLQTLLPLLAGLKIGQTVGAGFSNASLSIRSFSARLESGAGAAKAAAAPVGALGKAVGFLGPVGIAAGIALGGLSIIMGNSQKKAAAYTGDVNDLVKAIQDGTEAAALYGLAQKNGVAAGTQEAGVSQKALLDGLTGSNAAYDKLAAKVGSYNAGQVKAAAAAGAFGSAAQKEAASMSTNATAADLAGSALADLRKKHEDAEKKVAEYAKAQGDSALAAQVSSGAYLSAAASLGLTGGAYTAAKLASDQLKQSTDAQTNAMVLENNAIGLLQASLNQLGGNNLGVAQSQTAMYSATAQATKSLHENKDSLNATTTAGLANRQALEGQASAAIQYSEQVGKQTGSTKQANAALAESKTRLLGQLSAQHLLTPAVQAYIDKLYAVPPVKPTKMDLQKAVAEQKLAVFKHNLDLAAQDKTVHVHADTSGANASIQSLVQGINGQTAFVHVQTIVNGIARGGGRAVIGGSSAGLATGGPVVGPGPKGVDSVLRRLAPGEFVMSDKAVDRFGLPFMQAVNKGQLPLTSAARGTDGAAAVPMTPNVYVQNPFTGEYLLAQVARVADDRMAASARESRLVGGRVA